MISQFFRERTNKILAIDEPLEYARLYLEDNMQMWVDAEDSLAAQTPITANYVANPFTHILL